MTDTPRAYRLSLDVDLEGGECSVHLRIYGEENALLSYDHDRWTTFCWTWQDLVRYVETRWQAAGGTLNVSLNRPSPFVDLT